MLGHAMPRTKRIFGASSFPAVSSSVLIFCFFFTLYGLTIHARLRYGDETERYLQAQSLVDRQSWIIRQVPGHERLAADGNNYSQFELGYGLLLVPPYIVGSVVSHFFPMTDRDAIPLLFVALLNPLISALTCVVLFWFMRALRVRERIAVCVAALYGLGTLVWPYSKGLYREPLQAFTLLVAVYALYLFRQTDKQRWYWIAAVSFGYLVFTKIANGIMLPLFGLYIAWVLFEEFRRAPSRGGLIVLIGRTLLFALPMFGFLAIQGAVNAIKFGDVLEIGPSNYRDPAIYFSLATLGDGITGFLFSPEKSIFLYAPPVILFLPAWWESFRRHKVDALFWLALVAVNLLYNSAYEYWGSVNWGPRYLVLVVPLLILPLGIAIENAQGWTRRLWNAAAVIALCAGLFVQLVAALVDDREVLETLGRGGDLAGALDLLGHRSIDSLLLSVSTDGTVFVINLFGWGLLALAGLLALWLIVRIWGASPGLRVSLRHNGALAVIVPGLLSAGLVGGLVAQKPAFQAKGNAKYVAGNAFFVERRYCEAQALYLKALYFDTTFAQESRTRLEQIVPAARGIEIPLMDRMTQFLNSDGATIQTDSSETLLGDGALQIRAPSNRQVTAEVDSEFIDADPNTPYVLAGWLRTEGLAGKGGAVVGWYEDDGKWRHARNMDLQSVLESRGWLPFRDTITTLPTTRRILIKVSLWQAYGTVWADGLRLVAIDPKGPPQPPPLCVSVPVGN